MRRKAYTYFLFRAKDQVKERIAAIDASLSTPSAPSAEVVVDQIENGCHDDPGDRQEEDENTWEDVKELLVLENSM